MSPSTRAVWKRARAWVAAVLPLCAAAPAAAQADSPLAGIDVFGTSAFTGADVRAEFLAELESIAAAFSTGAVDDSTLQRYVRVVQGLNARGDFAFLDLSVVQYFDLERPTSYVTVDVVERADSARRMAFRPPPRDTVPDPSGIMAAFADYLDRGMALLQRGLLAGPEPPCPVLHCPPGFHHESLREESAGWVREAPGHLPLAGRVLQRDAEQRRRAAAAFLLGFADDPGAAAEVLLPALSDPASEVRNNALRVLLMLAQRDPPVRIPVAPVIAALHLPRTTDRNKAAYVLLGLARHAENRGPILREAGPVLLDMLALEQPNNREPAHAVLRALSGAPWDAADGAAWRAWWRAAVTPEP